MTPAITSPIGGQPGTLMIGRLVMILWTGVAPVGFGFAAWMQPFDAQLPHATMAFAPSAASFTMSSAVRPAIVQWMPPSAVGIEPSTSIRYSPLYFFIVSCSAASDWCPAAACRVCV